MPDPRPEADLAATGYEFWERWELSQVIPFIGRELRRASLPIYTYWALCAAALLWLVLLTLRSISAGAIGWMGAGCGIILGLLSFVLLVPPHELLHGLMYRWFGARRVDYGADWRRLIFHATAPNFIVDPVRLTMIALAPGLVLTPIILLLSTGGSPFLGIFGAAAVVAHLQGCIGDFCMVNFCWRVRGRIEWRTFDEAGGAAFQLWRRSRSATLS